MHDFSLPNKGKLKYDDVKNIKDFRTFIEEANITIIGLGISNLPLIDFLMRNGAASVTCRDKNTGVDVSEFARYGERVKFILGKNYLDDITGDIIFKTPGIRRDLPQIKQSGALITSEMELFFKLCLAQIIAVTGSDGKTTTTTVIYEILKRAGKNVYLGGNIGKPLLPNIENINADDYVCVELSSFQLFDMPDMRPPSSAVITNITPNHLDWHAGMDEYIAAKKCIYKNQTLRERLVLGYDNPVSRSLGDDAKATVWYVSLNYIQSSHKNAVYVSDGTIIVRENGHETQIMNISGIHLNENYNILNYMAAIASIWGSCETDAIVQTAREFNGVEHRREFVREVNGAKYYNSSIDSSPSRTAATLNSFEDGKNIIIILGGYDKNIPFGPLAPAIIGKVKTTVLYGDTAGKILSAITGHPDWRPGNPQIIMAGSFDDSVTNAVETALPGDIVLLSPACASFGEFKNFEERGKKFKKTVMSL